MKTTCVLPFVLTLAWLVGCGDPATTASSAAGSSSAVASAAKPLADTELPVAADFEEEAETQITPATYKTELESLEKEVDAK
jgi:fructoselysine-6-P-deglycase FrlB-like protein